MNKWYIIIAALLICGGLVFIGLSNRYYIDTSTKLKVDRLTGKTYELPNRNTPPPTNTHKKTESKSNNEYLKNLELLKTHKDIYNKFKEYYNNVLTEYNKNPLFLEDEKWSAVDFEYEDFLHYSPYLAPNFIISALESNKNINTPDKYLEDIASYHKSLNN